MFHVLVIREKALRVRMIQSVLAFYISCNAIKIASFSIVWVRLLVRVRWVWLLYFNVIIG